MKKFISSVVLTAVVSCSLTGCDFSFSKSKEDNALKIAEGGDATKGAVYYLNFKPEIEEQWNEIAEEFTKDTGIRCKVTTVANGMYEEYLAEEMEKDKSPTLFQINGPVGYSNWKNYCADMTGTYLAEIMNESASRIVVASDGKIYGIPYTIEGYGIIYNDEIMRKYFELDNRRMDLAVNSAAEIRCYEDLKDIVEDMTKLKDELGIKGVFGATSFAVGEQWRWHTHLSNMALFFEANDYGATSCPEILSFTYGDKLKNVLDLYIDNSTTEKADLENCKVDESMEEFARGECAMIQNGNWSWTTIKNTEGKVVNDDDVKMMPIYMGVEGEEDQGLCIGTEGYYSLNVNNSPDDMAATFEFLEYVFGTEKGQDYVVNKLGYLCPFTNFEDIELTDTLATEVYKYSIDPTVDNVKWIFATYPSETFKVEFGGYLLNYITGKADWSEVQESTIALWNSEAKKAAVEENYTVY